MIMEFDLTRHGKARLGKARQGVARLGKGKARFLKFN